MPFHIGSSLRPAYSTIIPTIRTGIVITSLRTLRFAGWYPYGVDGRAFFCCALSAQMISWREDRVHFSGREFYHRRFLQRVCADETEPWDPEAVLQLARELLAHVPHQPRTVGR